MIETNETETENIKTATTHIMMDGQTYQVSAHYGWVKRGRHSPYFTVTGEITPINDTEPIMCGAIGRELLECFPWLNLIDSMHLNDAITGAPMYAVENGWYWFNADEKTLERAPRGWRDITPAQRAGNYLHVDPQHFKDVTTREEFAKKVDSLRDMWTQMAKITCQTYGLDDPNQANHDDQE